MSVAASPLIMPSPPHLADRLRHLLPEFGLIEWVQRTGSTNADLLQLARSQNQPVRPWLRGAHLQDTGRGRAGRTWQNRAGANLMFSCAFNVFLPARQLGVLSPLLGVASCEALQGLLAPPYKEQLSLKWPNDVQWKLAKLAGILVEVTRAGTAPQSADHHVVIIGMGLNLQDARALSTSLNRAVADWSEVLACDAQAADQRQPEIVVKLARAWESALARVVREGLEDLPARYAQVDYLAGQYVHVIDRGQVLHAGIAGGINACGQMLIRTSSGLVSVSVGEVSIRPLPNDRLTVW